MIQILRDLANTTIPRVLVYEVKQDFYINSRASVISSTTACVLVVVSVCVFCISQSLCSSFVCLVFMLAVFPLYYTILYTIP